MRSRWWWLRLQLWQWLNAWRAQPVRRTLSPLSWLLAAIVVPAGVALSGAAHSRALLQWVLSLDIPLTLLLAAQVGAAAVAQASGADPESWISPRPRRGSFDRVLQSLRWLHVARWPVALAMAALILAWGDAQSTRSLAELVLLSFFGLTCGALFAWNLGSPKVADGPVPSEHSRASGLAVLSSVPFRQASRQLNRRRVLLLTAPVMLAAPMGSLVQHIAAAMGAWVLLLYVSTWMREARRTVEALRKWLHRSGLAPWRLQWLVWRYVIPAALLSVAVLWFGWRVAGPGSSRAPS